MAEQKFARREFILNLGLGVGSLAGLAGVSYFGVRYLLAGLRPVRYETILAGRLDGLPVDGATEIVLVGRPLIVRREMDSVRAFSAVCPHLGCLVQWEQVENHFLCPCHIGIFDANGQPVSGPPTEPLPEFDVRVDGSNVYVSLPEMQQVGV